MAWCCLLAAAPSLLVVALLLLALGFFVTCSPYPQWVRHPEEKVYIDPSSPDDKLPFPSLTDDPTLDLSVVVPAYNERERLPPMMDECLEYLDKRERRDGSFRYEVIVVDDGSTDDTTDVALKYSQKWGVDKVRVLTLKQNRGKGGAVRLGMLSSRGKHLLFADADGATRFSDIEKLEESLKDLTDKSNMVVVVGSRAHLAADSIAKRSLLRTFLMYGFHLLVWLFGVRSIRDSQCGFKLMTREASRLLFASLHVEKWAFDVELLYLAEQFKMLMSEVPVHWTEIEGSKIVPFWSWIQMGRDLVLIWLKYRIGVWQVSTKLPTE